MKVEDIKSTYQISEEIQGLYRILNDLSRAVSDYNRYMGNPQTQVCAYAPDTSIPEVLNVRDIIKEFRVEVAKLKVVIIEDIEEIEDIENVKPSEDNIVVPSETINDLYWKDLPEKLIFDGLDNIKEDELLKLNFLRLTSKEEVFNSYKEELEKKYNG